MIVGWSQVIGGALACAGQFRLDGRFGQGVHVIASVETLLVSATSIVAGVLLLSRHRFGVKASLGIQLLQVFAISGRGHWVFAAGGVCRFLIASTGVGIQLGAGGQYQAMLESHPGVLRASGYFLGGFFRLGTPMESAEWVVGINLVALYFARRLWRLVRGIPRLSGPRVVVHAESRATVVARARELAQPQFDEHAKRIHERSRDEAELLMHQYIGPEHLLLAIVRDEHNEGARALAALNVDVDAAMSELTAELKPGKPKFNPHRLYPHTSRAALVMQIAVDAAASQGLAYASPGHLLLAIMREGRSIAAKTLTNHGVNEAALRGALASSQSK